METSLIAKENSNKNLPGFSRAVYIVCKKS